MTDVGKTVPAVEVEADEEAGSEVLEWELCESAEQEEERRAEELGTENEGGRNMGCCFLPRRSWCWQNQSRGQKCLSLGSFLCFFLFFSAIYIVWWIGLVVGQGGACTVPSRTVCGQETDCT